MTRIKQTPRPRKRSASSRPRLRFTPTAWAKLLDLRDRGPTEIGGFGISSLADPLLVREFVLVPQSCSPAFVAFDDAAVADYFDTQVDLGRQPAEFGRIWLHTHPGISAQPSPVDEATFQRVFGGCQWSVMFILARGGETYARLQGACGLPISQSLAVEIDFTQPFAGSDHEAWEAEYLRCVRPRTPSRCFNPIEHSLRHLASLRDEVSDWQAEEAVEFQITPEFSEEM